MTASSPIILAYSGGLDTSFCVPWLREQYNRPVVTVCINTGGIDATAAKSLEKRAIELGADEHILIEAREIFFERVLRFLIAANARRGHLYPLCVGAERGIQAAMLAELATKRKSKTVAHGCTAAGNDQVRFEVALHSINPDLEVLAPIRDESFIREDQIQYLKDHNFPMPPSGGDYSINRGLWGVTIGGKETLNSLNTIPESEWVLSAKAFSEPQNPQSLSIKFKKGIPVELNDKKMSPVDLIESLEIIGGNFGIGRGIHLGDTVLGTKGRVAFEAPAAEILINSHRELEKLNLSLLQSRVKDSVSASYSDFLHEGKQLDPACRDIEALLISSQQKITGEVKLKLRPGNLFVEGVSSPYSLMDASKGTYGEAAGEWTAEDALGFSRILSLPGIFQSRADSSKQDTD
ncbi:MAG: argininosuccinate synthase [Pseudomonadota bacterium]|nr:argininosuccinate synthase [Pseudomonadota bacterium]